VGAILSLFEKIAPVISPDTLITDTGSTKEQFAQRARMILGESAGVRVLPGHPMAGREVGGIDNAVPELFRDAAWLITPLGSGKDNTPRQQEYLELIHGIGARVIVMDPDRHDRLCAWVSHLPQMMATALATALRQELGDDEAVSQIGGRALREMTRIAHSPYSMWRDIALTNTGNIEEAILRFEQELAHLRENLRGPGLREMFESANKFGKSKG
jgi:prephenate dehydrogenase